MVKEIVKMDAIEEYIRAYNGNELMKTKAKRASTKLANAKERLIAHMDSVDNDSVKRNGFSMSRSKRNWGKVTDYEKLTKWVEDQDEPRSQYMEEVFIKGSQKDPRGLHMILKDAQLASVELRLPLSECMPKGFSMLTTDVITVRKVKDGVKKLPPKTAVEQLANEMEGF